MNHFTKSLRFKVTLLVIAVELLIFSGVGVFYTHRFSQEIDNAIIARLSIPGLLMTRGELSFDAVSDKRTMEGLLREPYSEGIVIGLDGQVYFSSDPARLDTHLDEIDGLRFPDPEASTISIDAPDRVTPVRDSTGTYLTCLSPLRPNGKLTGYLYLKVGTEISEAEKREVALLFAIGSLATIALTAAILSWLLHLMVTRRLNSLVEIFRCFAQGDYATRAQPLGRDDEIATLMNGFNGLATRLEDTMAHLSESESRFRVLVEHAPEAILVYDVDTKLYLDANQNAERLFACSLERLQMSGPTDFFAPVQPDPATVEQTVGKALAGQEVVVERAIINAIGQQLLCEVRLVLLPSSNRRLIRASYTDITERKRAEGELRRLTFFQRTILNSAAYGIISVTPDGVITGFNPAAERLLGYTADEVVGKQTPALWHDPHEIEQHARQLTDELGEKIDPGFYVFAARPKRNLPEEREWTFIRKDGTRVPVNLSITALRDEGGSTTGFVGLIYDLTERKRAEDAIRELNQELEQRVAERTTQLEAANKELEAFAYSVSHDLRAPLRHIDGFLGLLKDSMATTLDERSQHYMDTISKAAERMGVLIEDLLSFSRMGRQEINRAAVDLGVLVQDVIHEFEPETMGRVIHWQVTELPVVTGDRAMLRVVLVNLISNALKFTRPREQAEIAIGCLPGQATDAVIFVRDNGVGFDMQYAGKLFGVFERLHGVEEFEGTGIGLANVRRVIARHGGRTWAEGNVDAGATFYFSLPLSVGWHK